MKRLLVALLLVLVGCRGELPVLPSDPNRVTLPNPDAGEIKGFFVLNEGNMGSNRASLDWFDYTTGIYHRNIFPERNPDVARELGDVGNDLAIYGDRLWAVINCSHLVEVMDVTTAQHLGVVSIPNPRRIVFDGDYAYVSSFAGPVETGSGGRLGYVAKIDTRSLQVVGECTVGYQPEGMAVAEGKLYVANSGGYRAPDYDRTVSVIDLGTFREVRKIDVAINLHDMVADPRGTVWVASRGNNGDVPSELFAIDPRTDLVAASYPVPVSRMALAGDRLLLSYSDSKGASRAVIDTRTGELTRRDFITDGTGAEIALPYGLAVNPSTGEMVVTDAGDYLTPGRIHCYSPSGVLQWSATAGDIPAHIAFSTRRLLPLGEEPAEPDAGPSPYVTRVFDFMPAPGQYTNLAPRWSEGDTSETMREKALAAIGEGRRGTVSLGAFGGYITVGFDHTIENVAGRRDFRVLGNAFDASAGFSSGRDASSEPGIIMVSRDENGNGEADDEWYEIAGSAHRDPLGELWSDKAVAAGNDVETLADYSVTYFRPESEPSGSDPVADYIRWEDNLGREGYIPRNEFHTQSYFSAWAGETLTLSGTRLPQNGIEESAGKFVLYRFGWGYADNAPNADDASAIDIDWAVDSGGRAAGLAGVDFVRIHTGVNQQNGWVGECSTEVSGVEDLHLLGVNIPSL
jgi:DNA-binding beta-propeller fold protein YncE